MATTKLSDLECVNRLKSYSKAYFTVEELIRVLEIEKASIYVTLNRLVEKGILSRVSNGVYQVVSGEKNIDQIVSELYYPSYISYESALSKYGILSQIPTTITLATTNPSKRTILNGINVEFRQLKRDLFWGYDILNGISIAKPEKALLDMMYYQSKGLSSLTFSELSLTNLDKNTLLEYSAKYPKNVKKILDSIMPNFGNYHISV